MDARVQGAKRIDESYEINNRDLNWYLEEVNPIGVFSKDAENRAYETISPDGKVSLSLESISPDAILKYVKSQFQSTKYS